MQNDESVSTLTALLPLLPHWGQNLYNYQDEFTCCLQASVQTDLLRLPHTPPRHLAQLQEHGGDLQSYIAPSVCRWQVGLHGSVLSISWLYVGNLGLSYAAALLLSLVFEAPALNLQKIIGI